MLYAPPELTRVSQQQIGATDGTCLVDGFCVSAHVLTEVTAAVATLAFAVAFLFALTRLHDASDALENERERTRNERDAFESFVEAVADVSPENPRLTDGGARAVSQGSSGTLSTVVDAYRDTVLDLDHYDDEYDDSLAEHMTAELGDDVALAVSNGAILSPQLQQTLCVTGLQAKDRRENLLTALDAEADSLSSCTRRLRDVERDLDAVDADASRDRPNLVADWQTVHAAEDRTADVLEDRQRDIHDQKHVVGGGDGPTAVYEYVYGALPSSYPVLSAATSLLERTQSVRQDISRSFVKQ